METHERKVDGKIHQTSQDIVDRTDIMLYSSSSNGLICCDESSSPLQSQILKTPDQVQSFAS
jgi:hypothetical protein